MQEYKQSVYPVAGALFPLTGNYTPSGITDGIGVPAWCKCIQLSAVKISGSGTIPLQWQGYDGTLGSWVDIPKAVTTNLDAETNDRVTFNLDCPGEYYRVCPKISGSSGTWGVMTTVTAYP